MLSEKARTNQLGSLEDERRGPVHHQKPQVESCPNSPWKGSLPSLHVPEQQNTLPSVTFGSRCTVVEKLTSSGKSLKIIKKNPVSYFQSALDIPSLIYNTNIFT